MALGHRVPKTPGLAKGAVGVGIFVDPSPSERGAGLAACRLQVSLQVDEVIAQMAAEFFYYAPMRFSETGRKGSVCVALVVKKKNGGLMRFSGFF